MTRTEIYAQLESLARLDEQLTLQLHSLACSINSGLANALTMNDITIQEDIDALLTVFPELGAKALGFSERVTYWQGVEATLMTLIVPEVLVIDAPDSNVGIANGMLNPTTELIVKTTKSKRY